MTTRTIGAVLVAALVAAACSGGDDFQPDDERTRDPGNEVDPSIAAPSDLQVRPSSDEPAEQLELSFTASPDAEGHRIDLDDGSDPIPVTAQNCTDDGCALTLDWLAVAGAGELTVSAVVGDRRSEASDAVDLPDRPEPEAVAQLGPDDPVELVVVSRAADRRLTVDTEQVPVRDVEARMAALDASPDVVGVQPAGTAEDSQGSSPDEIDNISPFLTWYEEALDYESLPPQPRGEGITVAVIDGGIDVDHPAFAGADITTIPMLDEGFEADAHGTEVASLIAASTDSPIPAIAPAVSIRNYDINDGDGPDVAAGIRAIVAAVDDGADVINISWVDSCSSWGFLPVATNCEPGGMEAAIDYAEQHGVVVVAGAGNDGDGDGCSTDSTLGPNQDHWPAAFPTVITVGATSRGGERWACSNDTGHVDVLAPGHRVLVATTNPPDGYGSVDGTSFAAPLVSGLVAIMLTLEPDLTPADVRSLLWRSTTELSGRLVPGRVMAELGFLPEGPYVEPGGDHVAYPYSLELQLRPGHPVQQAARAVENAWLTPTFDEVEVQTLDDDVWGASAPTQDDDGSSFHVTILGTLFAGEDGAVTGYGVLESLAGGTGLWEGDAGEPVATGVDVVAGRVGHQVVCPEPQDTPELAPYILFDWTVPAVTGGQLVVDDESDLAVDLSLSLGHGATADQPGELGSVNVIHDDLDDGCPGALSAVPDGWNTCRNQPCANQSFLCNEMVPDACWDRVVQAREDMVRLLEDLYTEIVAMGPVTFSDDNIGFSDGVASVQTELSDDVDATLTIGSVESSGG